MVESREVDSIICVERVDADLFDALAPAPLTVFDRTDFAALNAAKVVEVLYLLLRRACSGKVVMGMIVGRRADGFYAPFSAPYTMPRVAGPLSVNEAAACFAALHSAIGQSLKLTLPPDFYAPHILPDMRVGLMQGGARMLYADFNYHADVVAAGDVSAIPRRTARQEMRRVLADAGIEYETLSASNRADVERVYRIIEANHLGKGYPVKMSLGQVQDTIAMLGGRVGVVRCDGHDAAAQLGYFSAAHVYQPVYWGDLDAWRARHVMKALYYYMCADLRAVGFTGLLDLGPSSEEGVPSPGLCAFKESLGCTMTPRSVYIL